MARAKNLTVQLEQSVWDAHGQEIRDLKLRCADLTRTVGRLLEAVDNLRLAQTLEVQTLHHFGERLGAVESAERTALWTELQDRYRARFGSDLDADLERGQINLDLQAPRCVFCGGPPAFQRAGFMHQTWWACRDHQRVPYPELLKPDECRGSCLGEIACNG